MRTIHLLLMLLIVAAAPAKGLPLHCDNDTAVISAIIERLKSESDFGAKLATAAESLQGAGLDDYYRTDSVATLRVSTDSFTPLMFVNTVIALAKTSERPGAGGIATFEDELVNIACRKGENKGFPSIMYHASDWIGDNSARGNITELTENYAGVVARTKSLDEMTRKRGDYVALADSAVFENVRMTEMGFRTHRIPSLKKETVKKKEIIDDLQDGDIILLVPNGDGIDIYDMGIVAMENGVPHLIHLSPQTHTVVKEIEDLARYMALVTKYFQGYRILRVKD